MMLDGCRTREIRLIDRPLDPGEFGYSLVLRHRLEVKPHFKRARMSCPKGHGPLLIQGLLDGMGRETWAWPSSVNRRMDYKGEARQRKGGMDL